MNKIIATLIISASLLSVAGIALAELNNGPFGNIDLVTLLNNLVKTAGIIIASLGGVMIVIAGILYMISAGDPERIGLAKKALMYAIIGIVVGGSAAGIVQFVQGPASAGDFKEIITEVGKVVGSVVASLGGLMVVIAGIFYMTSAGDPERVCIAKKTLIYAMLGIFIGLSSTEIIKFINPGQGSGPGDIIKKLEDNFTGIVADLGGLMVIISAIFYLTSAGDPERAGVAKKTLIYAVVGMVIALSAKLIVDFVSPLEGLNIGDNILVMTDDLFNMLSGLGTIMFIVSAILYLAAGGDPSKKELAKKILIYAIIGLVIGLSYNVIVGWAKSNSGSSFLYPDSKIATLYFKKLL